MVPAFILGWPISPVSVLWPVWAVLILRSPWNQSFVAGTLAWAMLMAGGFLVVLPLIQHRVSAISTVLLLAPGLMVTVVTQALWTHHKQEFAAGALDQAPDPQRAKGPSQAPQRGSGRRPRRRRSRPGRQSRHPS